MDENNDYTSRQERRRQMRNQESAGFSRGKRRLLLWGSIALVLVVIVWGMVRLSANVVVPTSDGTLSDPITGADHSMGPIDAAVTLVEYSDFQCPACAAFYPVVKRALAEAELKEKVRFVYRSLPLTNIHPNAQLAAQAAEAASAQGKFWEMHDALFESQTDWSGLSSKGARGKFLEYAKNIGLTSDEFASSLDAGVTRDAVAAQAAGGSRSGVNATPTFFLNGKKMAQPSSYEQFRQLIVDAVNANP